MSERIACNNQDCANTILPATASTNDGLCMPCVQAIAKQERDEFIKKNRRDLNEFEGIDDPVEVLKIIHRGRKFDPLINWVPHPTPTEELYAGLTLSEQQRFADYVTKNIGEPEGLEFAEMALLCLTAFTDANVDDCLRALVSVGEFWPGLAFFRSPDDVRDALVARVENDQESRGHILLALAWIGDDQVVELFRGWRSRPPEWRDELYLPPEQYSRSAGWELDAAGKRRNLYFESCTKLLPGFSAAPNEFLAISEAENKCPWCARALVQLFDLVPSSFGLPLSQSSRPRLQVVTCEVCTAFTTLFGKVDSDGIGQWSEANSKPEFLPGSSDDFDLMRRDAFCGGGERSARFAADRSLPTTFSQIGGLPSWDQDEAYPQCPSCSQTMMFLGQIDRADIERFGEGMYYAFVCPPCKTTATNYQQT